MRPATRPTVHRQAPLLAAVAGLAALATTGSGPARHDQAMVRVAPLVDPTEHSAQAIAAIGRANLACAQDLPPTPAPSIDDCIATVESWAARVRSETDRHHYRFERNPAEFENSEAFFRMLMLTAVLAEDFGIHYDDQRKAGPAQGEANNSFFAEPRSVFLTGLLGPERRGTCSSMPVLYVAVGRELWYPLMLVTTKGHLFVRWEGGGERFNIEATSRGLSRFDDDYYRHWPFQITPEEEAAEGYLKSLTPPKELAVFLSIRGMCLKQTNHLPEAAASFAAAARLAPGCRSYRTMQASLEKRIRETHSGSEADKSANLADNPLK